MVFKNSLALSLLLLSIVNGEYPFWMDPEEVEDTILTGSKTVKSSENVYRLPGNVKPLEYDIYIDMYFDEKTDRPFSYDGIIHIVLQAVELNVTQIVLHANVDVKSVSLLQDGTQVLLNPKEPFIVEPQYHFLKVNLLQSLEVGSKYILTISYSKTMNEGPLKRGIWKGWYRDAEGKERIYAATHFQPYSARQAFPCWDEPLYKAIFRIHLSRPTSYGAVFSNTGIETRNILEGGRVRDNFYPTPKMSSYLVTFLVSENFQVIAEDTSFKPPVRIIGRSNTAGLGNYALERAVKMTKHFDEYFDMPFASLNANLNNDHISTPDWASAGTENWGMVGYRELYMIVDSRETLMSVEHYATTLIAHEIAHTWFGNLITCFWWSNTWINEGFASYFGYIAANEAFPQYELHEHFNSRYLQNSLSSDSAASSAPMNFDVNTPAQVTGHFGTISYSKGAAFLRMTISIISEPTFKKACQYFLKDNSYMPTDQYDLYNAFIKAIEEDQSLNAYPSFNFSQYYQVWVNEPGYPLLEVSVNHETGKVILEQKRYMLSGIPASQTQVYPIPITYSTKSKPNFDNVKPEFIFSGSKTEISKEPGEEWIIFNNKQHNLYRVNYDDKTWTLIGDALMDDLRSIHHLNRAQIVDDVYSLVRSGELNYAQSFEIIRFIQKETNFHVWDAAITMFSWFGNRLRSVPDKQAQFNEYVLNKMEKVIDAVGYEPEGLETPTLSMNRQSVLHFACSLGHEKCIEESRRKFVAMRNGEWVNAVIRRNVYTVGIRKGGQEDFDFLMDRFLNSNFANDQLEMLRGLGCTKDPARLTKYLELLLTKSVRHHDKVSAFNYALTGNQENRRTVLQFVKKNIDAIRKEFVEDSAPNPVQSVMSNLASYLDDDGLIEFEEWLHSTQSNSLQYTSTLSAINSAKNIRTWGRDNADSILAATTSGSTHLMISTTLITLMTVLAITT